MLIPCLLAGIFAYLILYFIFKNDLKEEMDIKVEEVYIKDKFLMVIGLACTTLCIVALAFSSYLKLEMLSISLGFAVTLIFIIMAYLIKKKKKIFSSNILKKLPFELIPFVLSMFIIVISVSSAGITNQISNFLGEGNTIAVYGFGAFFAENLLNNIPMSVFFSDILNSLSNQQLIGGLFATIIGSNIGAYFTPLGALAGIMWLRILKDNGIHLSFIEFLKYGFLIALPVMIISLYGLYISLKIFG